MNRYSVCLKICWWWDQIVQRSDIADCRTLMVSAKSPLFYCYLASLMTDRV